MPPSNPQPADLTPKEKQVHDLLVLEGLTDGEMAARLGMTERAVKFHVQNLLQKTGAPDRFKMAVAFWRAWSGYDEQVEDAPRPVRRRGDPPARARVKAARAPKTSKRGSRSARPPATAPKVASPKGRAATTGSTRAQVAHGATRAPRVTVVKAPRAGPKPRGGKPRSPSTRSPSPRARR